MNMHVCIYILTYIYIYISIYLERERERENEREIYNFKYRGEGFPLRDTLSLGAWTMLLGCLHNCSPKNIWLNYYLGLSNRNIMFVSIGFVGNGKVRPGRLGTHGPDPGPWGPDTGGSGWPLVPRPIYGQPPIPGLLGGTPGPLLVASSPRDTHLTKEHAPIERHTCAIPE